MKQFTGTIRRLFVAALLVFAVAVGTTAMAPPAQAATCGAVLLNGADWLGGNGVPVHSNGSFEGTGTSCGSAVYNMTASPPQMGLGWQCVELPQRLYNARGWYNGAFASVGVAADIYWKAADSKFTTQQNGQITSIVPGDMIVHGTNDAYSPGAGHVTVVNTVNGSTVQAVQQNAPSVYATYTLTNRTLSGGSDILGIVHAPANTSASGTSRIIILDASGNMNVKEGGLNATWALVDQGVVDYRASSNRIAALDPNGGLWVKEGPLNAVWQQVATGVSPGKFAVTDDMVAVQWGTDLYTKVGPLGATWTLTINPVTSFKVSRGDHIAALMTNGYLNVQWGRVGTGWVGVANAIGGYDITDDMVGVLWGDMLNIKQGSVWATWGGVMNPVANFAFSPGDHIAANMTDGTLNVLWGPIGSSWTGVVSGYDSYGITDNRVGILQGGVLSVKEGSAGAAWQQVATGITSFMLT